LELVAAVVQVQSVATRLAQALVAMAEQVCFHLLLVHPLNAQVVVVDHLKVERNQQQQAVVVQDAMPLTL
jgi:hypothetical protein